MSYNGSPQRPANSWQSPASASDVNPQMEWQRRQDSENLNLLTIFYYISGGLHGLYTLGVFGYFLLFGTLFSSEMGRTPTSPGAPDPGTFGAIFIGFGSIFALISAVFTGLTIYAGLCLARRQNMTLVQVVAAFTCLNVPLGTALGVFTFIVLNRPTVRDLFDPGYLARQYETYR